MKTVTTEKTIKSEVPATLEKFSLGRFTTCSIIKNESLKPVKFSRVQSVRPKKLTSKQ